MERARRGEVDTTLEVGDRVRLIRATRTGMKHGMIGYVEEIDGDLCRVLGEWHLRSRLTFLPDEDEIEARRRPFRERMNKEGWR